MEINCEVIKQSYDFTIGNDGLLYGLINGDMGYESTGIMLDNRTLQIWELGVKALNKKETND